MGREFVGRREDPRLVTGHGRYVTDHNLPGQAYGAFVRADRAHATIRGIDTAEALAAPGVLAVLTHADIEAAGFKRGSLGFPLKSRDGSPMRVPGRAMLAADKARFVGELVALVVAESADQAQDASELVMVDYEDLEAVPTPQAAMAQGAPQLHEDAPGNMALDFAYGDAAAVEAAFAAAAHVAKVVVDTPRLAGNPMEPKSALVAFDAATGVYDLYLANQGLNPMRAGLSGISGVAADKLRVHSIDVGGAFGVRTEAYTEYLALMVAAAKLERPVKWTGTRSETLLSDHHGRGALLTGELALNAQGDFLAARVDWLVDVGAWWSSAGPMVNAVSPMGMAVNVYALPLVQGGSRCVFTNACPTTAYRGASRPSASYLMERLVDEAARTCGFDPIELRRRNLIPAAAFPYKTATGSVYDSADLPGLLDAVVKESDWAGFEARRQESAARGKLRGRGLAVFISPSGSPGAEQGIISFDAEGNIILFSLSGPAGQGHETAYPEVVGDQLGLDPASIHLRHGDPDGPELVGLGSFGSRSLISQGGALVIAGRGVIAKGQAMAAEILDAPLDEIDFEEGLYRRRGGNASISLQELIKRHAGEQPHPLETLGDLATNTAWPSGAHMAEVEIDPETGVMQIMHYTAVDDCGAIINPTLVEGQMHGGLMQGVGQVIGEQAVYDPESGQLLTGSFMDYFMPHAGDVFPVSLFDRPVLAPGNPLGAKGAGEAGTTGAIPTLANALIDALSPVGVTHLDLPFTPVRVWEAIQAAKAP
jgi:carbon-monoxide dehydrogenase large subunit